MKFINNFTATANQFLAVALLKKLVIKWKQQLGNLWSTCRDNFLKKNTLLCQWCKSSFFLLTLTWNSNFFLRWSRSADRTFQRGGGPHCVKQRVIICFRHLNNTVCSNKAHKGGGGGGHGHLPCYALEVWYVILLLSCYVLQCESVKRVRIISSKQLFNEKLSILITFLKDIVLKLRGEAASQSRKGFKV